MADQLITRQELIDAKPDVKNLGEAANGNETGIVTPRYGAPYSTAPAAIQKIESDGAAAIAKLESTGGLISAPTLTALQAITPEYDYQLARVDATGDEYRWNPALTTPVKWEETGRNFLSESKAYADSKAEAAKNEAIASAVEEAQDHLRSKIFEISYKVNLVALYVDKNRNVPVFLENGGLSFSFLGNRGKDAIINGLKEKKVLIESVETSNTLQPLVVDKNKNVPIYLEKGLLGFSGLAPRSQKIIQSIINPYSTPLPISTDGRTLWRYKAKCAKRKADNSGVIKVMTIGDSYMQLTPIPQAIANILRAQHGNGGRGWITAGEETYIDGITSTFVGAWTRYDRQNVNALTDKGYAIDGQSRSTVASGARWVLNNVPSKQLTVYYLDNDAVFDFGYYNAGTPTWQTVTGTNTGTIKSVMISGATAETSIFEVKRTSGTVFIYGFYAAGTAQTGVVVDACGNSGSTSTDLLNMTTETGYEYTFNALNPDLILFTLGTNDAAVTFSVKTFKDNVNALIDNFRRLSPTVSIVLIAPPRTNQEATNRVSLSLFRDALYEISISKQCDFLNLHDEWQSYTKMNNLGLFADSVHPNLAGGTYIAELLTKKLGI